MLVNVEPAVAATAPAPIEVHHVIVVVTVKHIGMTATTMHHGPAHVDGIDYQLHVIFMGVILTVQVVHLVGVEEIGRHGLAKLSRHCTAA